MRFDPTPPPLSAARSFLAAVGLESAGLVLFGGGESVEDEKHPTQERDSAVVDVWSVAQAKWLAPMGAWGPCLAHALSSSLSLSLSC